MNLVSIFDALEAPTEVGGDKQRFSATPIPDHEHHRIGKDVHGNPLLLLLSGSAAGGGESLAPIALQHLSVQYEVACRVTRQGGETEEGVFTVVRCTGRDRGLRLYFLHVANSIITAIPDHPCDEDIASAMSKLVELFHAMSKLPKKSVQGLWAELFCIARSREPRTMLNCWHQLPGDLYDFGSEKLRLEVKSASGELRQHHFALAQLSPPEGVTVLLASVFANRAGGGTSIADLVDEIQGRLGDDPELSVQLDRVVGLTLGSDWRAAFEDRFDREQATASSGFYSSDVVPSVSKVLPPGVSDVRFRVDLSSCPTVDLQIYRSKGSLFKAALRK